MSDLEGKDLTQLAENAGRAADFLKALANQNRLTILCLLSEGERSVSELEASLGIRQPTLSQQLAVLREENLVDTRREGKAIYYSLASRDVEEIISVLYRIYCAPAKRDRRRVKPLLPAAAD